MEDLKAHYETALAESERKMKLTRSLQEELEKFDADCSEFEHWLQQSEQELENLEAGADDVSGLMTKLKRQKSFSEDVISHKGDLRYITISGNRVLEAARSCSRRDGGGKADQHNIDTSATHREVQSRLDHATDRFRSLYAKVILFYFLRGRSICDYSFHSILLTFVFRLEVRNLKTEAGKLF